MLEQFFPDKMLNSPFGITADHLRKIGKTTVITDLDNTLIAWDQVDPTDELTNWFTILEKQGIKVIILSNNSAKRVERVAKVTHIPFIARARKPASKNFKKALAKMGSTPEETVMIGDQIMTDVLGGNRQHLMTIFVKPIKETDGIITKFNRLIEKVILKILFKKKQVKWEESL